MAETKPKQSGIIDISNINPKESVVILTAGLPNTSVEKINTYIKSRIPNIIETTVNELLDTSKPKSTGLMLATVILDTPEAIRNYATVVNDLIERYQGHHVLEISMQPDDKKCLQNTLEKSKFDHAVENVEHMIQLLHTLNTEYRYKFYCGWAAKTDRKHIAMPQQQCLANDVLKNNLKNALENTIELWSDREFLDWNELYINTLAKYSLCKISASDRPTPEQYEILISDMRNELLKNQLKKELKDKYDFGENWYYYMIDYIIEKAQYNKNIPVMHADKRSNLFPAANGIFDENLTDHSFPDHYIIQSPIELKNGYSGTYTKEIKLISELLGKTDDDKLKLACIFKTFLMPGKMGGTKFFLPDENTKYHKLFLRILHELIWYYQLFNTSSNSTLDTDYFKISSTVTIETCKDACYNVIDPTDCNHVILYIQEERMDDAAYDIRPVKNAQNTISIKDWEKLFDNQTFKEDLLFWIYGTCTLNRTVPPMDYEDYLGLMSTTAQADHETN